MEELLKLLSENEKKLVELRGLDMLEYYLLTTHLEELTLEQYCELRKISMMRVQNEHLEHIVTLLEKQ